MTIVDNELGWVGCWMGEWDLPLQLPLGERQLS